MPRICQSIVSSATWGALVALPAVASCADSSPLTFAHSIAGNGCTQEDIPGVEIFLTADAWSGQAPAPVPYIRIEVARPHAGAPIDIEMSPLKRDLAKATLARAALHRDKSPTVWLTGILHFQQDSASRSVAGSYSFCADDRTCFSGSFAAPWRPGPTRCG
jgi:hypothetical protein